MIWLFNDWEVGVKGLNRVAKFLLTLPSQIQTIA
jgi:hypothetical protein